MSKLLYVWNEIEEGDAIDSPNAFQYVWNETSLDCLCLCLCLRSAFEWWRCGVGSRTAFFAVLFANCHWGCMRIFVLNAILLVGCVPKRIWNHWIWFVASCFFPKFISLFSQFFSLFYFFFFPFYAHQTVCFEWKKRKTDRY